MSILPDLSDLLLEQVNVTTEVTVTVRAAFPNGFLSLLWNDLQADPEPVHALYWLRSQYNQRERERVPSRR